MLVTQAVNALGYFIIAPFYVVVQLSRKTQAELSENRRASPFKGAQAWDIRSLGFSWFLHHEVSTYGWLRG
jgi:hypothetical protein